MALGESLAQSRNAAGQTPQQILQNSIHLHLCLYQTPQTLASSGGGAYCTDSQMSLAQAEFSTLGARLSNRLWFALCSFCSLKAFHTAFEDEKENGGLPISGPGAVSLPTPLPN